MDSEYIKIVTVTLKFAGNQYFLLDLIYFNTLRANHVYSIHLKLAWHIVSTIIDPYQKSSKTLSLIDISLPNISLNMF